MVAYFRGSRGRLTLAVIFAMCCLHIAPLAAQTAQSVGPIQAPSAKGNRLTVTQIKLKRVQPPQLSLNSRTYAYVSVIARTDGPPISEGDPSLAEMTSRLMVLVDTTPVEEGAPPSGQKAAYSSLQSAVRTEPESIGRLTEASFEVSVVLEFELDTALAYRMGGALRPGYILFNLAVTHPDLGSRVLSSAITTVTLAGSGSDSLWGVPQPLWVAAGAVALGAILGYLVYWIRRRGRQLKLERHLLEQSIVKPHEEATRPPVAPRAAEARRAKVARPLVPEGLAREIASGTAIVALGAGASAQAGYPTGQQLLDRIVSKLGAELPDRLREALLVSDESGVERVAAHRVSGFGKAIDGIISATGRRRVIDEVYQAVEDVRPDLSFFENLYALPWRGTLSLVWDGCAADVLERASSGRTREYLLEDGEDLAEAIRSDVPFLLRPLGVLNMPTSLSLTIEEFRRNLSRAPEVQRALALLLQTHSFVFIGVGPETLEQFLQAVVPDFESTKARHFALLPDGPFIDFLNPTLARFGVSIVPYDASIDHRAVADFIEDLRESVDREVVKPQPSPLSAQVVARQRIEGIRLKNIGLFEEIDIRFDETVGLEPGRSQFAPWTVIFGGNGSGKSTVLKAIAFALSGNDKAGWGAAERLLNVKAQEGSIELFFGGEILRTHLVRDRRSVVIKSTQTTPVEAGLSLVLGFPALRGAPSPNPRGAAKQELRRPEPADLLPLVNGDVDRRLGSFKQWVINVLSQCATGNRKAIATRDLLERVLRELVPGSIEGFAEIDETFAIRVRTPSGSVPFDDMSQGMNSIFNWLGVLIQRLYDVWGEEADPKIHSAIVLIDEIDAHLHPEWQRRLVKIVREMFPLLQIIATSHSPLLAGALGKEETCVLRRDTQGRVRQRPSVSAYGLRSQDILTGPVFDMDTDRTPEVEMKVNEFLDLFERVEQTAEEKQQLDSLATELKTYGYSIADAVQPPDPYMYPSNEQVERVRSRFGSVPAGGPKDA